MKAAVYLSTRNRYNDMLAPMYSLLAHSHIDKVYFLIEDDEFSQKLPDKVECINVSNQQWFRDDGPNYTCGWSYMVLLRAALTKIFPQLDKIVQFDLDTIVNQDITDLWDIPMDGYYVGAAREPQKSIKDTLYVNTGVSIWNLAELRKDKADDLLIKNLNEFYFPFPDQDAIYRLFQGKIKEIPADYNINNYVAGYTQAKVYHFAFVKNYRELPLTKYYAKQNGEYIPDIPKGLDVIIPHYNNLQGLRKTLDAIYNHNIPDVSITVVDDASTVSLSYVKKKYPDVKFLSLEKNSGPGIARQYGIDNTDKEYIFFIDAGDYSSVESLKIIREDIKNNIPCLYSYEWFNEEHKKKAYAGGTLLHGHVFKRSFLNLYNLRFNEAASYSNEDRGFLYPCKMILKTLRQIPLIMPFYTCREVCVLNYEYNSNSLVHSNDYMFKRHILGFCDNMTYMVDICRRNGVTVRLITDELARSIVSLYADLMNSALQRPQYYQENLDRIKKYYFECVRPYLYVNEEIIELYFNANKARYETLVSPLIPKPDIRAFLQQLEGDGKDVRFDYTDL